MRSTPTDQPMPRDGRAKFGQALRTNSHILLFLGPCTAALLAVFLVPVVQTVQMSLHADTMGRSPAYVGLDNYLRIVGARNFGQLVATSVLYMLGNVVAVWAFGLGIALLLNRRFAGRALVRAAFIIPWAMPYVAASLIFALMMNYDVGVLNYLLGLVSGGTIRLDFLTSCPTALVTLTGISVWKLMPLGIVMMLSALQAIPASHYEAAHVDGATAFQRLRYITLPMLNAQIIMVCILELIFNFKIFDQVYATTQGGPAGASQTIIMLLYDTAFKYFRFGDASVMAVFVFVTLMAVTLLQWRFFRKPIEY